jgi:hypothetical protein
LRDGFVSSNKWRDQKNKTKQNTAVLLFLFSFLQEKDVGMLRVDERSPYLRKVRQGGHNSSSIESIRAIKPPENDKTENPESRREASSQ